MAAAPLQQIYWDTVGALLLPDEQEKYVRNYTPLAKKYGHPLGNIAGIDHRLLANTGKSGLTPISSPPPGKVETAAEIKSRNDLKSYQKSRFYGFTTAELRDLNALEPFNFDEKQNELWDVPIHPAFSKTRWRSEKKYMKHIGAIPILGEHDGLWEVSNPVIWRILEPCLKVATMLLKNEYHYSWLDALFCGNLAVVPPQKSGKMPLRLISRLSKERLADKSVGPRLQKFFDEKMGEKCYFKFVSGYSKDLSEMPNVMPPIGGATGRNGKYGEVRILVAVEKFQPLLRDDLTDAERLSIQLSVAKTLLHELAHAIWRVLQRYIEPAFEPYYNVEPLSELGFSFIHTMFGGNLSSMFHSEHWQGGPGVPQFGVFKSNWFTFRHESYKISAPPPMNKPVNPPAIDPYYTEDFWVVPTSWSCDMYQKSYWRDGEKKYGRSFTHMGPLEHGYRQIHDKATAKGNIGRKSRRPGGGGGSGILYATGPGHWIVISGDTTTAKRDKKVAELQAATKAETILEAMDRDQESRNELLAGSSPPADDTDPGERPPRVDYDCPRFDEIKNYLINNRGPKQLALDSMTLLSEPQLYRYIRDSGGIRLTGLGFRNFLAVADQQKQLFVWDPFPGRGLVARRKAGWPAQENIPLASTNVPSELAAALTSLLSNEGEPAAPGVLAVQGFQGKLFKDFGLNRDLDKKKFLQYLKMHDKKVWGKVSKVDFRRVIDELVDSGSQYITHSAEGIVRFIYDIPDHIYDTANAYARARIADMKQRAKN